MDGIFLLRGLERILILALSGFLIYLGYKLFILIPEKSDSKGKVVLPGGVSIFLSRIGPGAFFALFGTIILIYSVTSEVAVTEDGKKEVRYMTEQFKETGVNTSDLDLLEMQMSALNNLDDCISETLEGSGDCISDFETMAQIKNILPEIKTSLLLFHWQESWGNSAQCLKWLSEGSGDTFPDEWNRPVSIYKFNN